MKTELNKWVAENRDEARAKIHELRAGIDPELLTDDQINASLDFVQDNAPMSHIFPMPLDAGVAGLWCQYRDGEYLLWTEL